MNVDRFLENKSKAGILYAFKVEYPQHELSDRGTHERVLKLNSIRRAFIYFVVETKGLSFSEAEAFVDGTSS